MNHACSRYKEVLLHVGNQAHNDHRPWNYSKVKFLSKQSKADYTKPSAYLPITISKKIVSQKFRKIYKAKKLLQNIQLDRRKIEGFQTDKSAVKLLYMSHMECQEGRNRGAP